MEIDLQLILELHIDGLRQGPGGKNETLKAIDLTGVNKFVPLKILDVGCGTGASTITLLQELNAEITAVDLFPEFLQVLIKNAEQLGLQNKINTINRSMDSLPFYDKTFDVIWSEGAVYNMGFENGIKYWKKFLKNEGIIAVSDLTWLTSTRPEEVDQYWKTEYPEVDTASSRFDILERNGYTPLGYFPLPKHCWMVNYYIPMQERFDIFLNRNNNKDEANAIVEAEKIEIELYEKYHKYYSYGFYIAKSFDN